MKCWHCGKEIELKKWNFKWCDNKCEGRFNNKMNQAHKYAAKNWTPPNLVANNFMVKG